MIAGIAAIIGFVIMLFAGSGSALTGRAWRRRLVSVRRRWRMGRRRAAAAAAADSPAAAAASAAAARRAAGERTDAERTTMPWRKPHRFWRHLVTDHGSARRAFPRRRSRASRRRSPRANSVHRGQVCFAVEPALPLARVLARLSPRERALEVFGQLRVWDTEENCGVLVYLLLADRDVEIVADRGIHARVGAAAWEAICRSDGGGVSRRAAPADGAEAGIDARSMRCSPRIIRATAARAATTFRIAPSCSDRRRRASVAVPAGLLHADEMQRVALRLVQAMAKHHQRHRAGDEEAEHDDGVVDGEPLTHHQRVQARPSPESRCSR